MERIGFLLIDDFALMSFATVSEPFRAANHLSNQDLYSWQFISTRADRAVTASNGMHLSADLSVGDNADLDYLFVCAAGDPAKFDDARTFAWLRRLAAKGTRLAGVSGGTYVLARGGLLSGRQATIHWEHFAACRETFPQINLVRAIFVIDGDRLSCAGGTAGLDLAIEIISRTHGNKLGASVGDWYIRTRSRDGNDAQRASLIERYATWNPKVLEALAAMEANIASPLPRAILADRIGASPRHLERLFASNLARSVGDVYFGMRLERAVQLLRESSMSVTEIAIACGFSSQSHFSKRIRGYTGASPRELRQRA